MDHIILNQKMKKYYERVKHIIEKMYLISLGANDWKLALLGPLGSANDEMIEFFLAKMRKDKTQISKQYLDEFPRIIKAGIRKGYKGSHDKWLKYFEDISERLFQKKIIIF